MDSWVVIFPALVAALIVVGLFLFGVLALARRYGAEARFAELLRALHLSRALHNPVLSPTNLPWEQSAVLNPAAVRVNGRTHLFYRAIGNDGVSRIGYARSEDGRSFTERSSAPVFALPDSFSDPRRKLHLQYVRPDLYASGGSFAGVEDPRAVVIDGRLYLTFQAFSDWATIRLGVTSLSLEDLEQQRWRWTPPVYLSPPGKVIKNWVLFPKKIDGRYAVLLGYASGDRNTANIAYLDSLDQEPQPYLEGDVRFRSEEHPTAWDSIVRSAGPPPLETKEGWLVLYHANDKQESHKYKLGAMLLDKDHPERVVKRSPGPVLSPDAVYENEGAKSGIVYACGAVIDGDKLYVYYGGADTVVCVAETSLTKLLKRLVAV